MSSPGLLLLLDDVGVELGAVLGDGVLVVVVDGDLDDLVALGLVGWVMELGHEGVSQRLVSCDALVGVELQQLLQHVEGIRGGSREHVGQGAWPRGREGFEHGGGEGRVDGGDVVSGGTPSDLDDLVELVHGGGTGEHGLAPQQLTQDAPNAPHVDALGVLLRSQEDLWGTVPAGGHVVSEHRVGHIQVLQGCNGTCQSKISYLDIVNIRGEGERGEGRKKREREGEDK